MLVTNSIVFGFLGHSRRGASPLRLFAGNQQYHDARLLDFLKGRHEISTLVYLYVYSF